MALAWAQGRPAFFKTSLFADASVAPVSYQGVRGKWKSLGMGDIPRPRHDQRKRSILGGQPNRSVAGRAVAELIVQADAHDMIVQVAGGAGESVGGGAKDRCGQKTAADERACDRYSLELGIQVFRS